MPRAKAAASSLSELMDSPAESSDGDAPPQISNQENDTPPKRGRGKAKPASARKTKPASKRLSGGKAQTTAKRVAKRAPLKDTTNAKGREKLDVVAEQADEAEDFAQPDEQAAEEQTEAPEPAKPKRKGRPRKAKEEAPKAPSSQTKATVGDDEFEYTPSAARSAREVAGAHVGANAQMDLDEDTGDEDLGDLPGSISRQVNHARSSSLQPRPIAMSARRRAESTSELEQAAEPDLRRKLGEMTKKFESLDTKYRNLRDIGVKEAEVNFDKLKRNAEERSKVTNDLIASLRQELSTARQSASEGQTYRNDLDATRATLEATESRVTELMEALAANQNEVKTLQAKLTASRAASAHVEPSSGLGKTLGNSTSGKGPAARIGQAEAATAAQFAQLKENMYSDLTGLIMRNVDRQEEADIYDCIQTGRNGTLHFKLAVPTDANTSYEEAEIQYIPRLDSNRDRDLLEILPEYLRDEISFSTSNAAKFYSRVVDTLTRKFVDE